MKFLEPNAMTDPECVRFALQLGTYRENTVRFIPAKLYLAMAPDCSSQVSHRNHTKLATAIDTFSAQAAQNGDNGMIWLQLAKFFREQIFSQRQEYPYDDKE